MRPLTGHIATARYRAIRRGSGQLHVHPAPHDSRARESGTRLPSGPANAGGKYPPLAPTALIVLGALHRESH